MVSRGLSSLSHLDRPNDRCFRPGDVVYLRILNRPIIVLNSAEAATELLEKRGENYSDRPNIPIFHMWV